MTLQAPFQYFGGKSRVVTAVWRRLGDVRNYVEPFFGSGAVLLARPSEPGIETVNDIDSYVANFWRAVQAAPDQVAELMNWPVNESDLEARHKWLVEAVRKREHAERMRDDPDYFDAKIAAWWCWGLCAWIGRGWCGGEWHGRGAAENHGCGINVRDESGGGKLPHLGAGVGIHRRAIASNVDGDGECARRGAALSGWMRALADRLRNVRVCCGDWQRVCGDTPTLHNGITGMFFDPPYSAEAGRDNDVYRCEDTSVAHDVRAYCLERGSDPRFRIALCGYDGEHNELERVGWRVLRWKTGGGYANMLQTNDVTNVNRHRERIWFSPHCLHEPMLFDEPEAEIVVEEEE